VIVLQGVGKDYAGRPGIRTAVGQVDLTVARGEFVSIVGPSGCGKSSLLHIIAGFVAPTRGAVSADGKPVDGCLPQALGYIFQKDTLLPWYTVRQNIGLGLGFHGIKGARCAQRVRQLLEMGGLTLAANAYPYQLSGGMRRRVALLMSLAVEPRVLLLDEPFGALDMHTRAHLHGELAALWGRLGQTIVMVTHDLDEAVLLSDRVIVLSGAPSQVLAEEVIDLPRPRDVFGVRETAAFAKHTRKIWSVLGA
jgi:NitT/TauT family transport system ATP-binding protein